MKFSSEKSFNDLAIPAQKIAAVAIAFVAIVSLQRLYDATKVADTATASFALPPDIVRMMDLGLHSAVASYAWVGTMPDILTLSDKNQDFIKGLDFVNAVDPRLSFPYSFAVIVLPVVKKYPDRIAKTLDVGNRGIQNADPNWQIPFYLATTYYFDLKDKKTAIYYFDLAGRTPGAPPYIQTFGTNFGSARLVRDETKSIWIALYESTDDKDTKERALMHLDRIANLEFLENAAEAYKKRFGKNIASVDDLVAAKIIDAVPPDPFGFGYKITGIGTVEIDVNKTYSQ